MALSREADPAAFAYYARLKKVERYLEQNLSAIMSLETAAEIAGLEEKYFSTFFHNKTGVCFKDWVAQVRVTRAKEVLKDHNESITNVAYAVGFRDLRTFERAFKKWTGMTARAYKRSVAPDGSRNV